MTRDDFIDAYMRQYGIPAERRLPTGVVFPGSGTLIALECNCGKCQGWEMLPGKAEYIEAHKAAVEARQHTKSAL